MSKNKKKKIKELLHSKIFLIICCCLLILFSISVVKELLRKLEINREIKSIEQEIAYLEDNNKELENLIEYLNSSSFQEKEVKERLNLKESGENVVFIPDNNQNNNLDANITSLQQLAMADDNLTNPQRWWNYFFTK